MINIHVHSDYSNIHGSLDSTNKIDTIINTSLEVGLIGTALTDHAVLSGHFDFLKAIQKVNKQGRELLEKNPNDPKAKQMAEFVGILGSEIYLTEEGLNSENHKSGDMFYHMVLLAKDRKGWEQLNELSTLAWQRMFIRGATRTPNYISDLKKVIQADPGHLIASSACLGSYLGKRVERFFYSKDDERETLKNEIKTHIATMVEIFGSDFYLEIQPGLSQEQKMYNKGLVEFSRALNVPLIVATDAHYARPSDKKVHAAYLNSQDAERETAKFYEYTYIMSVKEIKELLSTHLEAPAIQSAIANAINIKDKIEIYKLELPPIIPRIPFEDKEKWESIIHRYDSYEYFNKFSHSNDENKFFLYRIIVGIDDYLKRGWLDPKRMKENLSRLNEEFDHIWGISEKLDQNMSTYFTTMQKIIDISWKVSVIAPGRGSAGAYLTNFILGITQDNPLDQPAVLPIYRFIHKDKVALPDIDFDTASSQRENVFLETQEEFAKYGTDVANIATFGTEKSKSALITSARGVGMEPEDGLYFSSLIPSDRGFVRSLHDCYYGTDDKPPIKEFVEAMKENPDVWEVAQKIEGLINRRGVHASGVVFFDNGQMFKQTGLMKSPGGQIITQFNLNVLEEMGCVKIDFLSTEGVDGLQTELYLLAEYGYIEWQGSLRETYNSYIHPKVLNYTDKEMWSQVHRKEVLALFQFGDSPMGEQAIEEVRPESLLELATINAAMRLMAPEGQEMPIIQYRRRKNDINIWYNEMRMCGLTDKEIKLLEKHVASTMGMCVTQEQLMEIVQDPEISNFTFLEGDYTRKVVAKKKMAEIEKLKKKFFDACKSNGASENLANYAWNNLFAVQLGYAFSIIHTLFYSIIAIQQMNLNRFYPPIFWATARLMVESGSIELLQEDLELLQEEEDELDDEKASTNVDYFKMGAALGKLRGFGINIQPPNINTSTFTFSPSVEQNTIFFGLKGISRINNGLIDEIIKNRPYESLDDFLSRIKVNKIQATMLIKAGAFDQFGERQLLLMDYCSEEADIKKKLTLQNMARLIELNLLPESLSDQVKIYRLTKHLKKNFKYGEYLVPDDQMLNYMEQFNSSLIKYKDGAAYAELAAWEKWYKKEMEIVKTYINNNHDDLLAKVNQIAIDELMVKYAKGNKAYQEMEALTYYYSFHELDTPEYRYWLNGLGVSDFHDLPEEPIVEWQNGERKVFRLFRIAGTAIGRDKSKQIVGFLTPSGFIKVKFYRSQFIKYDKQIKDNGMTEKSWFSKGSKLLLTGYRDGDTFIPKIYKNSNSKQALYKIDDVGTLVQSRLGE